MMTNLLLLQTVMEASDAVQTTINLIVLDIKSYLYSVTTCATSFVTTDRLLQYIRALLVLYRCPARSCVKNVQVSGQTSRRRELNTSIVKLVNFVKIPTGTMAELTF